ncbi:hypothetical protein FQA47_003568 [Oryzias melastigma]|uniref:DH domain-containing protein n=1 Tax=Oryzias melastigma TaxID=30732 RepID=A0A834CAI0_ORYME|nr:hypothetical protein FQA47_003568 [Oryzias melastigma]
MRRQVLQLHDTKGQQDGESKQTQSCDPAEPAGEPRSGVARPSRGKLLLHCFLQGLKAGLSEGTDARHQVAMQLLHSEWEYVSTLNQLYDRYRTPPAHQLMVEPNQTYVKFVEQLLQRHLLFRNTLQERLSTQHWKSLVGDILVQLIGQNDTAVFRHLPGLHLHPGLLPVPGVQQTEPRGEMSDSADGGGGAKAAVAAAGAGHSNTQLPESHPEPAAVDRQRASGLQPPAGLGACAQEHFVPLSCDPGGRGSVGGGRGGGNRAPAMLQLHPMQTVVSELR